MKRSNVILIVQSVCMYVIHLPFYLALILVRIPSVSFETIETLFTIGLIALLAMIPLCIVSFIFAMLNLTPKVSSPVKTTLITKCCLIPWYILNLLVCLLFVAGFLNPWLFLAVPALMGIEAVITYVFMLSTSLHSVIYTIKSNATRKIKMTSAMIVALVFHFFFVLDVIGAIILSVEMKKQIDNSQV